MVLRLAQQGIRAFSGYFQGFSDLPFSAKVSRAALPALAGLACLGLGLAWRYRSVFYQNSPSKSPDNTISKIDELNWTYKLNLGERFPLSNVKSYIHADVPHNEDEQTSFKKITIENAGLIITIGLGRFNFLHSGKEVSPGSFLMSVGEPTDLGLGYSFHPLQSRNKGSNKSLWHLHIPELNSQQSLEDLHLILQTIDRFIEDKGINLENNSLIVTSTFPSDSACFVLYHLLFNHLNALIKKESKNLSVEEIADRVLQNSSLDNLLKEVSSLVRNLFPHLHTNRIPNEEIAQEYRKSVLLPMIRKMRADSNTPAPRTLPASPVLSKDQQIQKKLEMLAGLNGLLDVDPDQDWQRWNQFIQVMHECNTQLEREGLLSYTDSRTKVWEYISRIIPIGKDLNFYKAMMKGIENPDTNTLCSMYRNSTSKKLIEQGYVVNRVSKEGKSVIRFYSPALLTTLQKWYEGQKQAEKAKKLDPFIEDLQRFIGIDNPEFDVLLQPLEDVKNGVGSLEYFELLEAIIGAYEIKPQGALKDYLLKVITSLDTSKLSQLFRSSEKRQELLFLLGECLTDRNRVYLWLEVLYREQIQKYGSSESFKGLEPALYAKVKESLIRILSNESYLTDLYKGFEGRIALGRMWLQVEEAVLLKAVPLIFKRDGTVEQFLINSDLLDIWEKFASDPTRMEKHPAICDLMLEALFKARCNLVPNNEFHDWMKNSQWVHLQKNKKLPLLQAAYNKAL